MISYAKDYIIKCVYIYIYIYIYICLDPNVRKHNLGGVGGIARSHHRIIEIEPIADQFKSAVANGRAIHLGLGLKNGLMLSVYVVYGWTGGSGSKAQASKTNKLFQAIRHERAHQPMGPSCIMGDFNADPQHIQELHDMLTDGMWTDLGAIGSKWGGTDNEYTCITANSNKPTRRDYIIVNHEMLPMVEHFHVLHDNVYPTHATLQLKINVDNITHEKAIPQIPLPLYDLLRNQIEGDITGDNLTKEQHEQWNDVLRRYRSRLDDKIAKLDHVFDGYARSRIPLGTGDSGANCLKKLPLRLHISSHTKQEISENMARRESSTLSSREAPLRTTKAIS